MHTNSDWLNKTANKSPGCPPWRYVIVHETASPNPDNPAGTLNYNLSSSVGSSYHDLIGRDGVRYRYLDPEKYVAWHAGVNTRVWVDGVQYDGGEVNSNAIGIELDGRCDGTPATSAQLHTMAELLCEYGLSYDFPVDAEHLIMHAKAVEPINPSYRSDARCTTIDDLVTLCAGTIPPIEPDSYERIYRVRYDRCLVRHGPARSYGVAWTLNTGDEFASDSAMWGEVISGDDSWIHLADGRGFITNTAVEWIS
jgi:hypothetical protein